MFYLIFGAHKIIKIILIPDPDVIVTREKKENNKDDGYNKTGYADKIQHSCRPGIVFFSIQSSLPLSEPSIK